MSRIALFLTGIASIAVAVPAAGQSMDHSSHGPAPAPAPSAPDAMEHKARVEATPDCPPEHAAMGHCTPKAPKQVMQAPGGASSTDLSPGSAPAPAPPHDWYADRIWSKEAMEPSRHAMMVENGGQKIGFISLNLAEYQARKGRDGFRWEGEAWYGGDEHRLVLKSSGEGVLGGDLHSAELQALYSRPIGPYFDWQAGVRHDFEPGPPRTYATLGFEGVAPYWFELEGAAFLSEKGDLSARLEGSYDLRLTQKLILEPRAELSLAAQKVRELGVGSGVTDAEVGLRLRYEFRREFGPYIGVMHERKFGETADLAREAGEDRDSTTFVVGVRAWF